MSHTKDSFDDYELTRMATEIMMDLAVKTNLDPDARNPYLYLFSNDDIAAVSLENLPSISSVNIDEDMAYLYYPSMSPPIPSPIASPKLNPINIQPINKNDFSDPCVPPINVNVFIEHSPSPSISSYACISPRNYTRKRTESHAKIPEFTDDDEINTHKKKRKRRKRRKAKNKTQNKTQTKTYISGKYAPKRIIKIKRSKKKGQQIKRSKTALPKSQRKNNRKIGAHSVNIFYV